MSLKDASQVKTQTGRMPYNKEGRDWSHTAARLRMPKSADKPPEARKRQGRIPLQVSGSVVLMTP